jgi:hypothetical protein
VERSADLAQTTPTTLASSKPSQTSSLFHRQGEPADPPARSPWPNRRSYLFHCCDRGLAAKKYLTKRLRRWLAALDYWGALAELRRSIAKVSKS